MKRARQLSEHTSHINASTPAGHSSHNERTSWATILPCDTLYKLQTSKKF